MYSILHTLLLKLIFLNYLISVFEGEAVAVDEMVSMTTDATYTDTSDSQEDATGGQDVSTDDSAEQETTAVNIYTYIYIYGKELPKA